jgi:hypothetical protein
VKHEPEEPSTNRMLQLSVLDSPPPLRLHCQLPSHRYQPRKRSPWRGEVNPRAMPGLLSLSFEFARCSRMVIVVFSFAVDCHRRHFLATSNRRGNRRVEVAMTLRCCRAPFVRADERTTGDVTLHLKDNIECLHLMCAPGIVAHINRQINRSIITVYIHHVITSCSSQHSKRKSK